MKPHALIKAIADDLTPFVVGLKGVCELAADEWLALQKLATGPAGFLAVVLYDGDAEGQGSLEQEPLIKAEFSVFVEVNTGLDAKPGAALTDANAAGRPGLLDLCWRMRERVISRTVSAEDCDTHATYTGMASVAVPTEQGRMPLQCYRLRFTQTFSPDAVTPR